MSTGATLVELLAVAVGGGTGAAARYGLDTYLKSRRGWAPLWSLAVVNLLGTALLGLILGFTSQHSTGSGVGTAGDILFPLIGVGLAGGFTTFSTVMVEVYTRPQPGRRIVGVVAMTAACCAVFFPALWGGAALAGA
ncbi:chromosome condensation protein CrcB [Corynebacterium sp. HMSC08A12]|uniref:fluoride efflux transporter FluC n=1 Tax=Corynebacterium sp. HMSC08A12 TaxID=1581134 RepID=UPI0008A59AE1|nr:CrcB family protein [Corynebacterium sp. HMSC08A12]OFT33505.1 chromosome condensation protein CrcB [Corynebacterium sp. HMSC08A12]